MLLRFREATIGTGHFIEPVVSKRTITLVGDALRALAKFRITQPFIARGVGQ